MHRLCSTGKIRSKRSKSLDDNELLHCVGKYSHFEIAAWFRHMILEFEMRDINGRIPWQQNGWHSAVSRGTLITCMPGLSTEWVRLSYVMNIRD